MPALSPLNAKMEQGKRPEYPGLASFFMSLLHQVRGPFLLALFYTYIWVPFILPVCVACITHPSVVALLEANPLSALFEARMLSASIDDRGVKRNTHGWMEFLAGTLVVHAVMYGILNGFFMFCDGTGFLSRFKLPRKEGQIPSAALQYKTLAKALVGQFLLAPITISVLYLFTSFHPLEVRTDGALAPHGAPPLLETWFHFSAASICNEFFFYIAHRAFHEIPGLYKFHKIHHSYIGTIGIAAEYAHPLEQGIANQFPTAFYCMTFSRNLFIDQWLVFVGYRLWETYEAHSGFDFSSTIFGDMGLTFGHRCEFHDFHHTHNCGNYGVYWLDYLGGTMDGFLVHKRQEQSKTTSKKN